MAVWASWLRGPFASRLQLVLLVVAAVLLVGIGFVPLFAGPGYEASLAAGLVLPSLAALGSALESARARPGPPEALARAVARGVGYALLALAIALLHGLRVGFCDPAGDTALLLLGGCFGAVMGSVWGSTTGLVAGELGRWPRFVAVVLALLGPAGGIAWSLLRFYQSPMVFGFDPFFGLFAGPLYDTVVDRMPQLVSYRVGSTLTLLAAGVGAHHLMRSAHGKLRPSPVTRPGLLLLGALSAAGSLATFVWAEELGHVSSTEWVRQALGRELSSDRCRIIHAATIPEREARLLGKECDAHLRELQAHWGTVAQLRPTVYLFASAAQKGELMGAARTEVAKPWRREVYVRQSGYPHPVLRHELAHVVAGEFGVGPFRVSGPLFGLIPDPGRIEGVAVASAPDDDADLDLQQWARVMLDLELLPDLGSVFRLTFLAENSSKAYTVAGAFVDWLHRTYGAEAVRRWYGGAPLVEVAGGKSLVELQDDWRAHLAEVRVPAQARAAAEARFDRPAIFGRRCPRVVDRLAAEADQRLASLDQQGAAAAYRALLDLDPQHTGARVGLGTCALRAGDEAEARSRYLEVAEDQTVPRLRRARAEEHVFDLDLAAGRVDAAARGYGQIARVVIDADHLRALNLKQSARDDLSRRAVLSLLVGDPRLGPSFAEAAARLAEWAAADPEDGTASYLLGRNLFALGRWEEGARHLDEAVSRGIGEGRIRREAFRLRLIVACARGNEKRAQAAFERYLAEHGESPARRAGTQRFAVRCGIQSP